MNLRFKDINSAWESINVLIDVHGTNIVDEDGKLTREYQGFSCVVLDTQHNNICIGSGWNKPALDEYTKKEILSPIKPDGFRYIYGERLFGYPYKADIDWEQYIDQINEQIIYKLIKNTNSRQAVAVTLDPFYDIEQRSIPCLQWIGLLLRNSKLHMHILFRSWDVERALPANLYGLSKLQSYILEKIDNKDWSEGPMHIYAMSAHKYIV